MLVFFIYHTTVKESYMIDISNELNYLIKKGYEPEQALRFIMIGESDEQRTESTCSATVPAEDYTEER